MRGFFQSIVVFSAVAAWSPLSARAAPPPASEELERLRAEMAALRREHAEKMAALEQRLQALESTPVRSPAPAGPPPSPVPPPARQVEVPPGAGGPTGPLPVYGAATAASKIFNPDIAMVGDFLAAAGGNPGGGEPSFELHEAEASFQAVVDPYARGDFFLTFGPDEVGIEEAFVTFPAVPGGLLVKAGKMKTAFGRVDALHTHQLPWTDRPLVTGNLLGAEEGLAAAGISVARLIPNPWIFLEATGQVYAGGSEVFRAERRRDLTWLGHLRAYQDLTESTNVDLGGSIAYGTNESGPGFNTRLIGADFTFRYRPLRRAIYRQLVARGEAVWSRRVEPEGARSAFGAYFGIDYKLARRWTLGGRVDYSERAADPSLVDKGGSLLLTFWPSEFSQVRGQYRHTRLGDGTRASEFLLQLLFSIGAHAAHPF